MGGLVGMGRWDEMIERSLGGMMGLNLWEAKEPSPTEPKYLGGSDSYLIYSYGVRPSLTSKSAVHNQTRMN